MKEFFSWLDRPQKLSTVVKGVRFLAILMGVLALAGLVVFLIAVWPVMADGPRIPLFYLLDEMDDEIEAILILIVGSVICAYVSHALRRRSRQAQDIQATNLPGDGMKGQPSSE